MPSEQWGCRPAFPTVIFLGVNMRRYLFYLVFILFLVSGLSGQSPERLVVRIANPALDLIHQYQLKGADIAGYRPAEYLDLVISFDELPAYRIAHPGLQITQTEAQLKANLNSHNRDIPGYHTYQTMMTEINELSAMYPDLMSTQTIGYGWGHEYASLYPAYAGYDHEIVAIKVSHNVNLDEDEPAIYFCGAHHAREPMSVEVSLSILNYLLSSYGTDPFVTDLLNTTQVWIVPMVNPDGHKLVIDQTDVWWRKNIRDNNGDHTINYETYGYGLDGVDINRNYGYLWGYISATNDNDAPTYHGNAPFSEPETQAFKAFLESKPFIAGISYHTYGQYVLYPYGYISNLYAPDETELRTLAEDIAGLINGQNSGYYDPMPAWELYPVTGGLDDWAYGTRGIFAYTVEMAEEFIPDGSLIPQIVQSNLNGAKRFLSRRNRAMLQGHVTDALSGAPIPAFIYVEGIDDHPVARVEYKAYSQTGSYWRFLSPGSYTVRYYLPGYISETRLVTITNTGLTTEDVALSPSDAQDVHLRIIQDNSPELPISGATLTLMTDPEQTFVSDQYGTITLVNFHPGAYRLSISKDGYNTITGLYEISDGWAFSLMQDPGFYENFESGIAMWTSQTPWGLSTAQSHSGSYALADSPTGNYQNNVSNTCSMISPVSLLGAESVDLQFYTRYNIALDGDYAALEYTTDGLVWNALDYYNGVQDWTRKSYDLTGLSGTDIRFRFRFTSNTSGRADGIYIDDIVLYISYYPMVGNADPESLPAKLDLSAMPNPFRGELRIRIKTDRSLQQPVDMMIYNLKGQKLMQRSLPMLKAGETLLNWEPGELPSGVYFIHLRQQGVSLGTEKILFLK